ncbi:MAG: pyridoxamine 5-phosphate oxidase-related FMN-binding protein [Acidimicrobiales bacterium]|nr:pyridoxamine 5-phosphate oxidase-related FMN-binding protein [Acidimicrobiales bacterium]
MGRTFDSIPDHLSAWMREQPVFFVGSAPLAGDGRVNVSPKDGASLRVLGAHEVGYLDVTGSGAETIAHVRENGRLTVMLCSFGPKPQIVRLYGHGSTVLPGDERWDELVTQFPERPGRRSIVLLHVDRIATSCGYGVPIMDLVGPRPTMDEWSASKSAAELDHYRAEKNTVSIDGLPAVDGRRAP